MLKRGLDAKGVAKDLGEDARLSHHTVDVRVPDQLIDEPAQEIRVTPKSDKNKPCISIKKPRIP